MISLRADIEKFSLVARTSDDTARRQCASSADADQLNIDDQRFDTECHAVVVERRNIVAIDGVAATAAAVVAAAATVEHDLAAPERRRRAGTSEPVR